MSNKIILRFNDMTHFFDFVNVPICCLLSICFYFLFAILVGCYLVHIDTDSYDGF